MEVPVLEAAKSFDWFNAPLSPEEQAVAGEYNSWQGPRDNKAILAPNRQFSGWGIVPIPGAWRLCKKTLIIRLENGEVLVSHLSSTGNFYGEIPLRRSKLALPQNNVEVFRSSWHPRMKYQIVSFYMDNTWQVAEQQKRVFNKFGYPIEQVKTLLKHGIAMDEYANNATCDFIIFFDIDCIPLHEDAISTLLANVATGDRIIGIASQSNHLNKNHPYACAACLVLPLQWWKEMGQPTMRGNSRSDTAEEITWVAEEEGTPVGLLWPGEIEDPCWNLGLDKKIGHGTSYYSHEDMIPLIYHAYECRFGDSRFNKKCHEVLKK